MIRTLLILLAVTATLAQNNPRTERNSSRILIWNLGAWSTCSASCGGRGIIQRPFTCAEFSTGRVLSDSQCIANGMSVPSTRRQCGFTDCPVQVISRPGPCSRTCGSGVRVPITRCVQHRSDGRVVNLTQLECDRYDSSAYNNLATCNNNRCPPEYVLGEWSACSKTCGDGVQSRTVSCRQMAYGRYRTSTVRSCRHHHGRTPTSKICTNEHLCPDNYIYKAEAWTPCKVTCQKDRKVNCFSRKDNAIVHRSYCQRLQKPDEVARCINSAIYVWRVGQWGSCSKTCGGGTRMREVNCVNAYNNAPAASCPLCLKPKDYAPCAQRPCPGSAGSLALCDKQFDAPFCPTIYAWDRCDLGPSCCDCQQQYSGQ